MPESTGKMNSMPDGIRLIDGLPIIEAIRPEIQPHCLLLADKAESSQSRNLGADHPGDNQSAQRNNAA